MAFLSNPQIHPVIGMGVNTLAAFATQKVDWHPQSMLIAAVVGSSFESGQIATHELIKSVPPLNLRIMIVSGIITSDKNAQGEKKENDFLLKKVARAIGGLVFALGLAKFFGPISMKTAAAFCIIPTLLLLNESQPKPRKHKQVS